MSNQEEKVTPVSWTLDDLQDGKMILCIGKSNSGKTYTTRYLLDYYMTKRLPASSRCQFGLVFVGSEGLNEDYTFLPDNCIINGYDEERLNLHLAHLKRIKQALKKKGKPMIHTFIVFDDLLGILNGNDNFNNFISLFRHYNVTFFMCNQYLQSRTSSTLIRMQTNYAFLWRTTAMSAIKAMYEWWGNERFEKLDDFKRHFLKTTSKKYAAMMFLDQNEPENNLWRWEAPPEFSPQKVIF